MNYAILDMIFTGGHKKLNYRIINSLAKNNQCIVPHNAFYDESDNPNIKFISIPRIRTPRGKIIGRIQEYYNLDAEIKAIKNLKIKIDYIFILTCDWIVLSCFVNRLKSISSVGVLHHNVNHFDNLFKRFFYNLYKNKVDNYVLEEFIVRPIITKYRVNAERVFLLKHPSTVIAEKKDSHLISQLSGSLNQEMIKELFDKKEELSISKGKIYIKNKDINYEKGNIVFSSHYLSDSEYVAFLGMSKIMLFFYPKEFNLRMSGVLLDALSNKIIAYSNLTPYVAFLKDKYPNIIHVYNSIDDLIRMINNTCIEYNNPLVKKEFEVFEQERNAETFSKEINRLFLVNSKNRQSPTRN